MHLHPSSRRVHRATFSPGQIFWLPKGSTWLNRDKSRPFLLATACSPGHPGTIVYGSSRETERRAGATCVRVDPIRFGIRANGLCDRTFFYPGILFRVPYSHLPAHAGFLGGRLGEVRQALRAALGIGTGSCMRPGAPRRSRRGRIVEVDPAFARDLRTPYAAILTEPCYSCELRYQVVVPLIRGDGMQADDTVLAFSGRRWLAVFGASTTRALVPVQVAQSMWHADDVLRETPYVLDEDTLRAIDSALAALFGL